ncbi:hypothetical protein ACSAZK_13145 [Methanosarcina sp. Mfa9]|uniref:hypothetical protein n=1 Tax=Methanosarcina sp. Mfa9 TaxID=3439063 RepID=UPI003F86374F
MIQKFRNLISIIMGLCVLAAVLVPAGALTVTPAKENIICLTPDSCEPVNLSDEDCDVYFAEGCIDNGIVITGEPLEVFDEEFFEIDLSDLEIAVDEFGEGDVFFSSEMLEDEFFKDIFDKIMTDYKEDVEKQDDGIILKGRALEAFDELCYAKELKEGVEFSAEMFAEEPFKGVLETIKKDYPTFVEEKDGTVILREKALEAFDKEFFEIEFSDMEIAFDEFGEGNLAFFPSEMLEDEFFKDIFEKIMTDYKEDVEIQDDGIILKGKALEAFDKEFFEIGHEFFADGIAVEENESGLIAVSIA